MQIKFNFKKAPWLLLFSQVLILYVCIVNTFPNGYTFAGGDIFQFTNFNILLPKMNYLWSNTSIGEGYFFQTFSYSPYYLLIKIFSKLFNLSASSQSIVYYMIFLFGSFWSFYFSLNFFQTKPKISLEAKILFSLVYAFNIYTFYNFYYTWGFSPFLFLYIIIPPLFGLTYKYLIIEKNLINQSIALLAIFLFLTNISYGNLAFFVSTALLLFAFSFLLYFLSSNKKLYLQKLLMVIFIGSLTVSWSLVPQILEMLRQLTVLNNGSSYFDLKGWILWQASHFPKPFFLYQPERKYSLPLIYLTSLFSFSISFYAIFAFTRSKDILNKRLIAIMGGLAILTIFLLNKGIGILAPNIIWTIFKNPVLSTLRSFDKSAIFLPFFLIMIIALAFSSKFERYRTKLYFLLIFSFISVFPFFAGGIQTKYSLSFINLGENYRTAKYSYLHQIPSEYATVSNELNQDKSDDKVLRAPYSVINSMGWANYPKWKQAGVDPTLQFFEKPNIEMNNFITSFGLWNYGQTWNKQSVENSTWLLNFAGFLNANYLMYQKDVDNSFIKLTEDKIISYEKWGYLTKIESTESFDLYKINRKFNLPHIYTPSNLLVSEKDLSKTPELLSFSSPYTDGIYFQSQNPQIDLEKAFRGTGLKAKLEYKKINPTRYQVIIRNAEGITPIIFSESFHSGWRIYQSKIKDSSKTASISDELHGTTQNENLPNTKFYETWFKKPLAAKHLEVNGYANSWLIDTSKTCGDNSNCKKNSDGSYDFEIIIDFWPQRLFYISFTISITVLITALIYLLSMKFKKPGLKEDND